MNLLYYCKLCLTQMKVGYSVRGKRIAFDFKCPNKACEGFDKIHSDGLEYKEMVKEKLARIPREQKQIILDLLREGLNVGQIGTKLQMDTDTVAGIIVENIETASYLRSEAK